MSDCSQCWRYSGTNTGNEPARCYSCCLLENEPGVVNHEKRVRCPKCRKSFSVYDSELYDLYEEGEHDVLCPGCDHGFRVSTRVSYDFESPALEEEEGTP